MFYVYVLYSFKDKKLYIGYTSDLRKRIKRHLSGKTQAMKNRLPAKLIYYEAFLSKSDAIKKEKFYKSGRGHEVLYKIIQDSLSQVKAQ